MVWFSAGTDWTRRAYGLVHTTLLPRIRYKISTIRLRALHDVAVLLTTFNINAGGLMAVGWRTWERMNVGWTWDVGRGTWDVGQGDVCPAARCPLPAAGC